MDVAHAVRNQHPADRLFHMYHVGGTFGTALVWHRPPRFASSGSLYRDDRICLLVRQPRRVGRCRDWRGRGTNPFEALADAEIEALQDLAPLVPVSRCR